MVSHTFKGSLKMSDSKWVEHINLKNFRYGLIPRPKANAIVTELFPMEKDHAETEEPERNMVRERAMQAVRPSRYEVRAESSA